MFCCGGSTCLDDEENRHQDKEKISRKQQNQQIYIQRNGIPSGRVNGKMNSNMLNYMSKGNATLVKPDVTHVTNVHRDIYVKLNGPVRNVGNSKTMGYQGRSYQVVQVLRSNSATVRHAPKRAPISKLNPEAVARVDSRPVEPVRDSMKLSTEFQMSSEDNRTSTPFGSIMDGIKLTDDDAVAIFNNTHNDDESLTDEQRNALEQLEHTLNDYQTDDEEMPIIIADLLPDGVFEGFTTGTTSPPESSEDEPSSRSSSLSTNSRTGIISQRHLSVGKKTNRNSVSFKLPVDHVDKPYAPMQTCAKGKQTLVHKPSPAPAQMKQATTICIAGSACSMNIWHNGNTVYVENKDMRRVSGPFKGSFKSSFYRKYSNADLSGYKESSTYLTPKILEKVASFESLTGDTVPPKYLGNTAIVRRSTIR